MHPFLQRLADHGLYDPRRQPVAPTLDFPAGVNGHAPRYAAAALDSECAAVAASVEGTRNDTLNTAAFNLGQLVAAGHLDEDVVIGALRTAATIAGLPQHEIDRTAGRAVTDGARHPRRIPQAPPNTGPAFTIDPGAGESAGAGEAPPVEHPFAKKMIPGGRWILDIPATPPIVWGTGQHVAWVEGESLIITGPPGVGKSTLVQQLMLARIGMASRFLGLDVTATSSKVLYLAMDRPRQIARSMRRMVTDEDRALLDDKLVVWQGPLISDVVAAPSLFAAMAEYAGADTIVVDSVKDTSIGLTDSEGAGRYNRARQIALDADVQMVEIAHQTKRGGDGGKAPKTLQDVHGGMELTAGAGSVLLIWGQAGDPVVEMRHLKQPVDTLGPWHLVHDGDTGRITVAERVDAYRVLESCPHQSLTAGQVAERLTDAVTPSRADVERARRQLEKTVADGHAVMSEMPPKATGGKPEKRYQWSDHGGRTTTWQEGM